MPKFKNEILVRDKRIAQMGERGIKLKYRVLSDAEFIKCLKAKLVEEATEVAAEETPEALAKELADVLEVLETLATASGTSIEEVRKQQQIKKDKTGGFTEKYYIEYVDIDEDNHEIKYFKDRADKYPEIK